MFDCDADRDLAGHNQTDRNQTNHSQANHNQTDHGDLPC